MLHPRVEHRFAFVGFADVFEQLFIRTALHHVIHRARAHRHQNHVLRLVRRQENDDGIRLFGENVFSRVNACRRIFHLDIDQQHVKVQLLRHLLNLRAAFRRADDLHIRLCAKRFAKVFPQQRKVVRQQYFHHSLTCPAHIWAAARRKTYPSPAGSPPADCPHAHAQSCAHGKAPCPSSCCCFWMNKRVQKSSSALLG